MASKSALELVVELKTIASNPQNRPFMIPQDQTVPPGLVMFLDHPSSDVVLNALETFYFLSLYPPNRNTMIQNPYLMPKLKFLMSNGKTGDIKRKAIATFTSMKKAAPTKATEEEPKEEESQNSTTTNNTATTTATSDAPLGNATNKTSIASGKRSGATFGFESSSTSSATSKNAATTITLYIKELSCETAKTDFERAMVNFRGVVSFWVELKSHRAVVRTTLTQEQLISAVSTQLGWLSSTEASFVSPKNAGYLDEEEIGVNGAIVQRGKSKKAKEAQAQGGGGWFSTVASYIW